MYWPLDYGSYLLVVCYGSYLLVEDDAKALLLTQTININAIKTLTCQKSLPTIPV